MNKEELEEKLAKAGIKGEWVNANKYGYSRTFQFELDNQIIQIEWYYNYSTIMIGNAHFWFDHININSCYPMQGEWIEFSLRGERPLHLKVR